MGLKNEEWQSGDILMFFEKSRVKSTWMILSHIQKVTPDHPESICVVLFLNPEKSRNTQLYLYTK